MTAAWLSLPVSFLLAHWVFWFRFISLLLLLAALMKAFCVS